MWRAEVPRSLAGDSPTEARLLGSHCSGCGRIYFPARRNCPICLLKGSLENVTLPQRGVLSEFAVAQVAPPGHEPPHAQGYIDLVPGGPRIFSLLRDYGRPEDLSQGQSMEMLVVETGCDPDGTLVLGYRFRPEQTGAVNA